ncbi:MULTISPECIES: hypothetical protein [unclassified Maridesulfovibrio]|uniref:hypothetical protein n=1 Tax=unclassified Maridesulfovibrio TaxID=2794999 RepID=UPI003B3FE49D
MGEKRKDEEGISLLIKKTSKTVLKLQLFDSMLWPDQPGAEDGKYRVKVAGCWFTPRGIKYDFMNELEILAVFRDGFLSLVDHNTNVNTKRLYLPQGTRVRVPNGKEDIGPRKDLGFVGSPAFLGADQQWHVFVSIAGRGRVQVPIHELEVV